LRSCVSAPPPSRALAAAFNAFFMTMRGKFTAPGTSIHYYVVEFDPTKLSRDPRGQKRAGSQPRGAARRSP
jgi:hypothetical protein